MEVLLKSDVEGLGKAGEVKRVANGYARNYLIPKGLAVLATAALLRQVEAQREAERRRETREEEMARELAARLGGLTLRLRAKLGEGYRLYGSITNADIATALEERLGESMDKRKVELEEPIKELGEYWVTLRLGREIGTRIRVVVEQETD